MFIRATQDLDLPAYNLRKGQLLDLPDREAKKLILENKAVPIACEVAVREIAGETATPPDTTSEKPKTAEVKRGGRNTATVDHNAGKRIADILR